MDSEKYALGTCPVARGASRVPDLWSIMILRDAGLGVARFDDFRRSLGIAPNILTKRLTMLVADGLLERRSYSDHPPRDEYVLTVAGRDYMPVLQAIAAWGRAHHGAGKLSKLIDGDTGNVIDPVVVDRATGRPLAEMNLQVVMPD